MCTLNTNATKNKRLSETARLPEKEEKSHSKSQEEEETLESRQHAREKVEKKRSEFLFSSLLSSSLFFRFFSS